MHTDFWAVVGAAAPVIVLATVVVMADSLGLKRALYLAADNASTDHKRQIRAGRILASTIYFAGGANMVLQSVAFMSALMVLGQSGRPLPIRFVINVEQGGLLAVAAITLGMALVRQVLSRVTEPGGEPVGDQPAAGTATPCA